MNTLTLHKATCILLHASEINVVLFFRQTPIEVLHTILLGLEKYLLNQTMKSLNADGKKKLKAKIESFDFSAFEQKVPGNMARTYGSWVGRDIKLWAQVAVFILEDLIPEQELQIWNLLSHVRYKSVCR